MKNHQKLALVERERTSLGAEDEISWFDNSTIELGSGISQVLVGRSA
jgi:hypothetical protein